MFVDRRKIEFDAENERSAKKWFNALQHRRENIEMITSVRRKKAQPFEVIHFETTSHANNNPSESDYDENNCAKESGTKQVTELATMKNLKDECISSTRSEPSILPSFGVNKSTIID
ncbi:unnamed protein product [Wuchereria bancrofti]|uniref:PH domain-containing protein n=1 Tax=Wuchereria bancrofti TaxID=6293 RepID=A0A3P7GH64_WUCBA|nr:unnamed protein product [Wuchereria bancrofti]